MVAVLDDGATSLTDDCPLIASVVVMVTGEVGNWKSCPLECLTLRLTTKHHIVLEELLADACHELPDAQIFIILYFCKHRS